MKLQRHLFFVNRRAMQLSAALCLCIAGLVGCGNQFVMPDPGNTLSATVAGPALQGSNFGGHAPLVGAHVFVLTTGLTGYGSRAADIVTNSSLPIDHTFDGGGYTAGYHYITTDSQGDFNISGDYACTPITPVFIAGYGGNPNTVPAVTVTSATVSGTGSPYTITFQTSPTNLVYQGETLTLAGFMGALGTYINASTQTVVTTASTATNLTINQFSVNVASLTANGQTLTTGTTYTSAGTATQTAASNVNNPGVVNMAVLGLCPASGVTKLRVCQQCADLVHLHERGFDDGYGLCAGRL